MVRAEIETDCRKCSRFMLSWIKELIAQAVSARTMRLFRFV